MPRGRVEPRACLCKACGQPFVTDKVGKAAQFCHRPACDERRERQRKGAHGDAVARRALQRRAEAALRRRQREEQRIAEREERAREREAQRIAAARRKAIEKKARKRGLEIFAPIMDSPDAMLMILDILEISQLASELRDPTWVDLRKAITRLATARPEGREASHEALKHLGAVAMRMADMTRTHATRDPTNDTERDEESDRALVAA